MKPEKPKTIRELLRSIENRTTPAQLDLLVHLWTECPEHQWTDKEKSKALKRISESPESLVDIRRECADAWRIDWVTNQLKQFEQILNNDED